MIYLRASVNVYDGARAQMDAARGLPAKGQITSFTPASHAPADNAGRVYLALRESDVTAPGADGLLSSLLASGAVEQITAEQYQAVIPAGEA